MRDGLNRVEIEVNQPTDRGTEEKRAVRGDHLDLLAVGGALLPVPIVLGRDVDEVVVTLRLNDKLFPS